jgi:5-methyltetrahydropteroyltriglutamate--homocysteine methyltransferase
LREARRPANTRPAKPASIIAQVVLKELPYQTIILGVLDLSTPEIETPETVAARIRRALVYRKPEDIIVAPDCGLKYLPREAALGKMKAMVEGARIVRAELAPQ